MSFQTLHVRGIDGLGNPYRGEVTVDNISRAESALEYWRNKYCPDAVALVALLGAEPVAYWTRTPHLSVTRLEVIADGEGRVFARRDADVELSYQDRGRTLKVLVGRGRV